MARRIGGYDLVARERQRHDFVPGHARLGKPEINRTAGPFPERSNAIFRTSLIGSNMPSSLVRSGLGQNHNLSAGFVLLHAAMRLDNLVERKGLANLDVQLSRGDLLNELLKGCEHEIFCLASVGR